MTLHKVLMSSEDRLFYLPKLVFPSSISASAALLIIRILVRVALKAGVLDTMAERLVFICCITITSELWNHFVMQTPAWPGVNALDYLQQYFVICKEQPGQAQTSQVSWHLSQWLSLSDCFIMQTPAWPVVTALDCLQQYFVICKEQPGQAQTSQVSWHLSQWLSLSYCFIMQTPAWPVVNTSDCLRQYFVICKEQGGQAQTSQVSWHLLTCMCTFWQRNWINDCSSFHVDPMWFWGRLQTMTTNKMIRLLKRHNKKFQAIHLRRPWDGWVW